MGCSGGGIKKDGFTVSTPQLLAKALGQKLIPVVDRVRDISTQLGLRPYRVHIIRTRWSGPRRGAGVEVVIHDMELLPTPFLVDMRSLVEQITPIGMNESGVVQLQKISGRYTEDQLVGVGPDGGQVAANETVYYEIEFFRPDGTPAEKRRFTRDSVPTYNATSVEWQVTLVNVLEKRGRDGEPRG